MDLFYGLTFEDQLAAYKQDMRLIGPRFRCDFGKKKIHVAYGYPEHVGNCMLVVGPPINKDKPFQDRDSKYLFQTASEFSINNIILISCFPLPVEQVSKTEIKAFAPWTDKLVEIFRPKFVVVLGEDAQFAFVKRKHILRDHHGKVVAKTSTGCDVYLSYEMKYYLEKSEYEDPSYKSFIRQNDWNIIAIEYQRAVK